MEIFTDKEKSFIENYVIDKNGTQAAIRAGYSEATANSISTTLLTKPRIKTAIELKLAELSVKNELTADRIVKEYMKLAFYETDNFYHIYYELATWKKGYRRVKRRYGERLTVDEYNSLPSNKKDFYSRYKKLKEFDEMSEDDRRAIVGVSYDKNNNMILKLADKQKALESLSKHLGIFEADNKQKNQNITVSLSGSDAAI